MTKNKESAMMTNSNLDPNYYNTLGYERAMEGRGLVFADTAGTNEECVAAYEQGWMRGVDDYDDELAECDDPEAWIDSIEDDEWDDDWSDDDCEHDDDLT